MQRTKIRRQQSELQVLKQSFVRLGIEDQVKVLKTIVAIDPRLSKHHTRGYLHRCPNGHWYIIGECGRAMEQSRCPDCGETIGGGSHQLSSGNVRITTEEADRFGI